MSVPEFIFSGAHSLHKKGFVNTVHVKDDEVFISNEFGSVILLFSIPEQKFNDVSFYAIDYEGGTFEKEKKKLFAVSTHGEYVKRSPCKIPPINFEDLQKNYEDFLENDNHKNEVRFHKDVLKAIDSSFPFVEIYSKDKEVFVSQKEITIKKDKNVFAIHSPDRIKNDFKSIKLNTNDFIFLFEFSNQITLFIGDSSFVFVEGNIFEMQGTVLIERI